MTINTTTVTSGAQFITERLLSDFHKATRSLARYRQFASRDIKQGAGRGQQVTWTVANKLAPAAPILETNTTPVEDITSYKGECLIQEYVKGTPFTKRLETVSQIDVKKMAEDNLAVACAESIEIYGARPAFASTNIKVAPVGGTSLTDVELTDTTAGAFSTVNDAALTLSHVLDISTKMAEMDVPMKDGKYYAVARPSTLKNFKKELQDISQYTSEGFMNIVRGKIGEYDNIVFLQQTAVPSQAWTNAKSDEAFFFGADSIVEVVVEPEHIIANVPADFNRQHALAYYALLGHSLIRKDRVFHWASAS